MRRLTALLFVLTAASVARAGTSVTTFENFNLPPDSFLNNSSPAAGFVANGNFLNNTFDTTFGVWSGWSISNKTDTTTPGFTNQYSAIPGSGAGGSKNYAVAFTFGQGADPFHPAGSYINLAAGAKPMSIQVTNTTYDYLSMRDGDQFTHKFGPGDFFELDVQGFTGLAGTGTKVGEVDFFLANFLVNNSFIVNTWQTLDLSSLADAESLVFGLRSSDNDPNFGMNTPAFFAVDNLVTNVAAVPEPTGLVLAGVGLVAVAVRKRKMRQAAI